MVWAKTAAIRHKGPIVTVIKHHAAEVAGMLNLSWESVRKLIRTEWLGKIPVIVPATSPQETGITCNEDLSCIAIISRPIDFNVFFRAIRELKSCWFELVTLPGRQRIRSLQPCLRHRYETMTELSR